MNLFTEDADVRKIIKIEQGRRLGRGREEWSEEEGIFRKKVESRGKLKTE